MKLLIAAVLIASCAVAKDADAEQALLNIQQAIESNDLATATGMLQTALANHPHDGPLLNLRGVVHAKQNELPDAHKDFADAVRFEPGLTPAWQNLARACQMEAEQKPASVSCAIDSWQHVERLKPGDTEAHTSLALLYQRSGKFTESLREAQKLLREEGTATGNLLIECIDLAALGRIPEAKAAASQLGSRSDFSESDLDSTGNTFAAPRLAAVAATLLEGLDSRKAATVPALQRLAIAYEQLGRTADARNVLERVASLDPKNTSHLLELARLAEISNNHEEALGYLAHARDLAPNDPQIHYLFAKVAIKLNLSLEARRSLERAIALDPENPIYNYTMGTVILTTRDAATASAYFAKFVKAHPAEPQGHYSLGIAYFTSGDYPKAKDEMERVLADKRLSGGAEYFLGRIARLEDQNEEAVLHLNKSIQLMPSFSESHTELARVKMLEGQLDAAHQLLDRALQLDPDSFQGNTQLLVLYKRTHDPRAAQEAEKVKQLDEDRSKRAELMLRTVELRPEVAP